ncbi:hypothetical protein QTO34_019569, partial [Cnephaeus nilssonii]
MLSLRCQRRRELSICAMAVLRHRRGLWDSKLMSRRGPSKAGELGACPLQHQARRRLLKGLVHQRSKVKAWELGACPLRHQAFQKPLTRWRLLKGLVHQWTGTQLPHDRKQKRVGDPTRTLGCSRAQGRRPGPSPDPERRQKAVATAKAWVPGASRKLVQPARLSSSPCLRKEQLGGALDGYVKPCRGMTNGSMEQQQPCCSNEETSMRTKPIAGMGSSNYDPRATCGPPRTFIRPAGCFCHRCLSCLGADSSRARSAHTVKHFLSQLYKNTSLQIGRGLPWHYTILKAFTQHAFIFTGSLCKKEELLPGWSSKCFILRSSKCFILGMRPPQRPRVIRNGYA